MKHKYQEALNYLKGGNMFGELSNEVLESIEVLIDKETPMKPKMVKLFGDDVTTCPGLDCGVGIMKDESIFHKSRYCGNCSQKIDWSEDE